MTAPALPDSCWPIELGCLDSEKWAGYDEDTKTRAIALASATLYRLTAGRVGGCPVTVRPIPHAGCQGVPLANYPFARTGMGWQPYLQVNGSITNCGCGGATGREFKLPGRIARIDEIKIDGVVLPPNQYRILDNNSVIYTGNNANFAWPRSQNLERPDTETGTFSVTYLDGHEVDGLGAVAMGTLADEFAKACTDGKGCRLPKGVTAVVRAGVSYTLDNSNLFPGGRTGIDNVDRWIAIWNPRGVSVAPTVWSPDQPQVRYER